MLTLGIVNTFLEELCFDKEKIILHSPNIVPYVLQCDPKESLWKIEKAKNAKTNQDELILWRKKAYLQDMEVRKVAKIKNDEFKRIHEVRCEALQEIKIKLAKELGCSPEDENILKIALSVLKKQNQSNVADYFHIDNQTIPKNSKPIYNIDGDYTL